MATTARYAEILTMGGGCGVCTSRTKPGDTLKLLGVSMAAPIDKSTAANTSTADLEKQLALLSSQTMLLAAHKENIKEEIHKLGSQTQLIQRLLKKSAMLNTLPAAVVHFVNLLSKANQYFEFKESVSLTDHLKWASNQHQLSHILLKDQRLMSRFRKMDESQVMKAAYAIHGEQYGHDPEDDSVLSDYIYNLVFQTREKGYHMHMDPMKELKKMMKSEPLFYDVNFCLQNQPMEFSDGEIEKACDKYDDLVRLMHRIYKKNVGDKMRSTRSLRGLDHLGVETSVIDEVPRKKRK